MQHKSVLLERVCSYIQPTDEKIIDGTLGLAGHARAMLDQAPGSFLVGLDTDEQMLAIAKNNLNPYQDRICLINQRFEQYFQDCSKTIAEPQSLVNPFAPWADVILLDLGLSMLHFKFFERGFSFQKHQFLDMRLSEKTTLTASELLNSYDEPDLVAVFEQGGENVIAQALARKILEQRKKTPIEYNDQLVQLVYQVAPRWYKNRAIHPATQVFQAIRIHINQELNYLEQALEDAFSLLKPGGRLIVIDFHSLEDQIVKKSFKKIQNHYEMAEIDNKKVIRPNWNEVKTNKASRSAKMRVLKKKWTKS